MFAQADRGTAGELDFDPREEDTLVMRLLRTTLGLQVRESAGTPGSQVTHLGQPASEAGDQEVLLRASVTSTSSSTWEGVLELIQVHESGERDLIIEVSRRTLRCEDDLVAQLEEASPAILAFTGA
jgi:hypothetical protein